MNIIGDDDTVSSTRLLMFDNDERVDDLGFLAATGRGDHKRRWQYTVVFLCSAPSSFSSSFRVITRIRSKPCVAQLLLPCCSNPFAEIISEWLACMLTVSIDVAAYNKEIQMSLLQSYYRTATTVYNTTPTLVAIFDAVLIWLLNENTRTQTCYSGPCCQSKGRQGSTNCSKATTLQSSRLTAFSGTLHLCNNIKHTTNRHNLSRYSNKYNSKDAYT
ncbi:hypothetical protein E3N88_20784 [Mikania micrantha]|uniref:Uncharacterized protein n=1 Tax=Mikania micrantha TaxID=192012 RepID=A0A5N6NI10_9ASTR|nr:hypothetical protein E3N88_20784 [Mikania micrantha]